MASNDLNPVSYFTLRRRLWGLPCPHVWPFQEFVETERACYLIRQYIFSNLYDRLSMRPFLAPIEKVCYQGWEQSPQGSGNVHHF